MTKLYELNRNTKFRLVSDTLIPPDGAEATLGDIYLLLHIDGMYSYCLDAVDTVLHIAAWSDVEKVNE